MRQDLIRSTSFMSLFLLSKCRSVFMMRDMCKRRICVSSKRRKRKSIADATSLNQVPILGFRDSFFAVPHGRDSSFISNHPTSLRSSLWNMVRLSTSCSRTAPGSRKSMASLRMNSDHIPTNRSTKEPSLSTTATTFSSASGFYESIGKPKFVAAPMVAQSDFAFRTLCRRYGVDCAYTQMYHAANFCKSKAFQKAHLDIYPSYVFPNNVKRTLRPTGKPQETEDGKNRDNNKLDTPYLSAPIEGGPLIAQIAGHDPKLMLQTAQIIIDSTEGNVQGIDVNLGCPQTIARKGRYGAFLLREIDVVTQVLSTLRTNLPSTVGVTAKIRIPDYDDAQGTHLSSVVHQLCSKGRIDLLTVHGRTLLENKTAVRHANWDKVRMAVDIAQGEYGVPVLANGGIETYANVGECLDHTGAQGVMSSEALLENPGLFSGVGSDDPSLTTEEIMSKQFQFTFEYLQLAQQFPPVHGSLGTQYGSHHVVKSHVFKFLHRYLKEHTDLRDKLGKPQTCTTEQTFDIAKQLHERYLAFGDYQSNKAQWNDMSSSDLPHSTWYRRHRVVGEDKKHHMNNTRKANRYMDLQDASRKENVILTTSERKDMLKKRIDELKKKRREGKKSKNVLSGIS